MKIFILSFLVVIFFYSHSSFSQCSTGIGRTEGSSSTTTSTYCTNPNYHNYPGGAAPGGMGSYPPEYFIQQSIRREACKSAAKSGLEKICANEVDKIQQDGITSCNTGIAVGGAVAAAGGIGLTILGFITAPVSVPMVVIGVVVFSSMAIGGGYVATVAGTQCKDEVQWNHDSNNRVCAEKVEEGVNRSCNF